MVRKKRARQPVGKKNDEDVDMDEMGDLEDMTLEDVVTDSEEEYTETERKLLEKVRKQQTTEDFDSDDEIYKLQDSNEEEEEEEEEDDEQNSMKSDIEGLEEGDNDIPNDRAWGSKAKTFYSSDYKYTDYASAPQKDVINADMEEDEGRRLHLRSMGQHVALDSLHLSQIAQFIEDSKEDQEDDKDGEHVAAEKSFMFMVNMFKNYMTEVRDVLAPFLKLVEDGTCPDCDAVTFIRTRYEIILNYCTNISFCLMLKAKGIPVKAHPVINRLAQYNQMLDKLQSEQGDLLKQVAEIVRAVKEGKPLYSVSNGSEIRTTKKKSILSILSKKLACQKEKKKQENPDRLLFDDMNEEGSADEADLDDKDDRDMGTANNEMDADLEGEDTNREERKRAITYEIAKNRGLTPYRKKELRNPRVKHRTKYRKALIRRRGAVSKVRKELTPYRGEISGIKAGAIKSIKLK